MIRDNFTHLDLKLVTSQIQRKLQINKR